MSECTVGDLEKRLVALEKDMAAVVARSEERDRRYVEGTAATSEAVRIAQTHLEQRLNGLNELRGMVIDNEKQYARSEEVKLSMQGMHQTISSFQDRVNDLADLVHTQVQRGNGMRELVSYLIGGIGVLAALATTYFHLGAGK